MKGILDNKRSVLTHKEIEKYKKEAENTKHLYDASSKRFSSKPTLEQLLEISQNSQSKDVEYISPKILTKKADKQ